MINIKSITILLTLFSFLSCERRHNLSKTEFDWMPYKGSETLVFTSNIGDKDTIFLLKKDTLIAYPEAQNPFGKTYEVVSLFCKHTDPAYSDRYIENEFYSVSNHMISIGLLAKDAVFYSLRKFNIDSLEKMKPLPFQTKYSKYTDVFVFDGEDYLGTFHNRSDFVTRVYWSKSQGLIRFDKKDTIYWELKDKYYSKKNG